MNQVIEPTPPDLSDAALKAALNVAIQRLGRKDEIRQLLGNFVEPGATVTAMPYDRRQSFLDRLDGLIKRLAPGAADTFVADLGQLSGIQDVQLLDLPPTTEGYVFWAGPGAPAEDWIAQRQAGGGNLYFSFNAPVAGYVKKANKESITLARGVHIDLDPNDDPKKPDCRDWTGERERLLKLAEVLKGHPMGPHIGIDSGNGVQFFWLTKPTQDLPAIEAMNRDLGQLLGGDPSTWNIDRVMRLPGTDNIPNKAKLDKGRRRCPAVLLFAHKDKALYTVENLRDTVWPALGVDPEVVVLTAEPQGKPLEMLAKNEPPGDAAEQKRLEQVVMAAGVTSVADLDEHLWMRLALARIRGTGLGDVLDGLGPEGPAWKGAAAKLRHAGFNRDDTAIILSAHAGGNWEDESRMPRDIARCVIGCHEPTAHPEGEDTDDMADWEETDGEANEPQEPLGQHISLDDLRSGPIPAVEEIVERMIQAKTINVISGVGGIGKSGFAFQMAMAVAADRPIWGLKVVEGVTVIYLSYEDDRDELKRRFRRIEKAMEVDANPSRLHIRDLTTTGFPLIRVMKDGTIEELPAGRMLRNLRKSIPGKVWWIADGKGDAVEFEDPNGNNNPGHVRAAVRYLARSYSDAQTTGLLLMHPSVAGEQRKDGLGGSPEWHNALRGLRHAITYLKDVMPPPADAVRVLRTHKRNSGVPPADINFHWLDGIWQPINEAEIKQQGTDLQAAVVRAAIAYFQRGTPMQKKGAVPAGFEAMVDQLGGGKAKATAIKAAAEDAVASGTLGYLTRNDTNGNGRAGYCDPLSAIVARATA